MTLRELRTGKGMTQQYVADQLEVTQTAVSNWEHGKVPPLRKSRKRLSALYGVSLDEIQAAISESRKEKPCQQQQTT